MQKHCLKIFMLSQKSCNTKWHPITHDYRLVCNSQNKTFFDIQREKLITKTECSQICTIVWTEMGSQVKSIRSVLSRTRVNKKKLFYPLSDDIDRRRYSVPFLSCRRRDDKHPWPPKKWKLNERWSTTATTHAQARSNRSKELARTEIVKRL